MAYDNSVKVSGCGSLAETPKRESQLAVLNNRQASINMRLIGSITGLHELRDRTLGAVPQSANKEAARPSPTSAISALHSHASDAEQLVDMLESVVRDLQGI